MDEPNVFKQVASLWQVLLAKHSLMSKKGNGTIADSLTIFTLKPIINLYNLAVFPLPSNPLLHVEINEQKVFVAEASLWQELDKHSSYSKE